MKMKIELNEKEVLEIVTLYLEEKKQMKIVKPLKINVSKTLTGQGMGEHYEATFDNISGEIES